MGIGDDKSVQKAVAAAREIAREHLAKLLVQQPQHKPPDTSKLGKWSLYDAVDPEDSTHSISSNIGANDHLYDGFTE